MGFSSISAKLESSIQASFYLTGPDYIAGLPLTSSTAEKRGWENSESFH